jgi:PAS domain S-box-containing protein
MEKPLLMTVLESLTEGVFTVDGNWKITSFNRAAEKITGISRQDAIGRKCWDVFHASICQSSCALKKTINTHKSFLDLKINIKNKDGRSVPVSVSTAVLRDSQGEVVGGVETFRDLSAVESLKKEVAREYTFEDIIGKHHTIQDIFGTLPDIAQSDSTVLIQGASGTGKELFARAIHDLSPRKGAPFVTVHCGALPDTLLESELFGYVKGAFTDAKGDKAGRFFLAEGGTIFLDEIGDISPSVQVKLLRVLQQSTYEPLGSNKTLRANVRIITATNRDLLELIKKESYREDMYYRISVVRIHLPTLSERRDDIPLLVDHFIEKFNVRMGKNIIRASNEVMDKFMNYGFPGNVRELENIIEHAFVLCHRGIIEPEHLPRSFVSSQEKESPFIAEKTLQQTEAELIRQTLRKYYGHRGRTAKELGIHKTTLWRKIKQYGLDKEVYGPLP